MKVYVEPKPLNGWLKNAVSKICTVIRDNFETVRDKMSVSINR